MDGYEEEFDYEAYEKKCDEIREANDELLELFMKTWSICQTGQGGSM